MRLEIIETSSPGDRSYVVIEGDAAVVIDAQRDIDRISGLIGSHDAHHTHELEKHVHNDYVTGGLELVQSTSAQYVVPAGDDLDYPARRVRDGDLIDAGNFTLRVIHTPGHTREHVSYELPDASSDTVGVFTGGSMLFDSIGRTDLRGPIERYVASFRVRSGLPSSLSG